MTQPLIGNEAAWIQQQLFHEYSSSQGYFYASKITDIVRSKRTRNTLLYDDLECLWQEEDFMKRLYLLQEHPRKMAAFKEYYYYHEDCPRIFAKGVERVYERWHEKRRDVVYKKLKQMFNESYSSSQSSEEGEDRHLPPVSHFLFDLSEYNPYSKKYYLRVQAKKDKEEEERRKKLAEKTKSHISRLNHDLSNMLNDLSAISQLSTHEHPQLAQQIAPKTNFKKKKIEERSDSLEKLETAWTKELRRYRQSSELSNKEPSIATQLKNTSKEALVGESKLLFGQKFRTRSIISLSSLGSNRLLKSNSIKKEEEKGPVLTLKPHGASAEKPNQAIMIKSSDKAEQKQSKSTSKSTLKPISHNRHFSLKKLAHDPYLLPSDAHEFSDKKLVQTKGLTSFKSEETGRASTFSSQKLSNSKPLKVKLFFK